MIFRSFLIKVKTNDNVVIEKVKQAQENLNRFLTSSPYFFESKYLNLDGLAM